MSIDLSVIVPSTPFRTPYPVSGLIAELDAQMMNRNNCELLCLIDNERLSIGEKLNRMHRLARGRFISLVADDDMIVLDYVPALLDAIKSDPVADVIVFDCDYYVGGEWAAVIHEGKDVTYGKAEGGELIYRYPSDKMCWRRDFLPHRPHIDTWETSDIEWANRVRGDIQRETRIDRVLYEFRYNPDSERGAGYRRDLDKKHGKPA